MDFRRFLSAEDGGIMIDWVALVGGSIVLGIAVVYYIFSNGVSPVAETIANTAAPPLVYPQPAPPQF